MDTVRSMIHIESVWLSQLPCTSAEPNNHNNLILKQVPPTHNKHKSSHILDYEPWAQSWSWSLGNHLLAVFMVLKLTINMQFQKTHCQLSVVLTIKWWSLFRWLVPAQRNPLSSKRHQILRSSNSNQRRPSTELNCRFYLFIVSRCQKYPSNTICTASCHNLGN